MSGSVNKNEIRELTESIAKELAVMVTESPWATRFVWAAILHGALAAALTFLVILGELSLLRPTPLEAITSAPAGILLVSGFLSYLLVGVVGQAVTALFYQYLEVNLKAPYGIGERRFAWTHLVLTNVGVVGSTWLTIYGAYQASGAGSAVEQRSMFAAFQYPIMAFVLLVLIGIVAGGLGYLSVYRKRKPAAT